jgi:VCBS repeat-containing protein
MSTFDAGPSSLSLTEGLPAEVLANPFELPDAGASESPVHSRSWDRWLGDPIAGQAAFGVGAAAAEGNGFSEARASVTPQAPTVSAGFAGLNSITVAPVLPRSLTRLTSRTAPAHIGSANDESTDPPVANDDRYGVFANTARTVDAPGVLANDTGVHGDVVNLWATPGQGPSHGTLALNLDGSFTYTPDSGYVGEDSFTYDANDGVGSARATVTLNVHDQNSTPVASELNFSINHNHVLGVPAARGLVANSSDADYDPLTPTLDTSPQHGSVVIDPDGGFTYTPTGGYVGGDSFTYCVSDGLATSDPATVTLDVTDTPPAAAAASYQVLHDRTLRIDPAMILANDSDPENDPLTFRIVDGPTHGALDPNGDGTYTYTPDAHYVGGDAFTYVANDGWADSNVAAVVINVSNAPPVARDLWDQTSPDVGNGDVDGGNVVATSVDYDGDPLTATLVSGTSHGDLQFSSNGAFFYRSHDYSGNDSFTYKVNDGVADSNVATVTITVLPRNHRPDLVANDDEYWVYANQTLATTRDNGVTWNDFTALGPDTVAHLVNETSHGALALNADGSFVYSPEQDYTGVDSFSYYLSDPDNMVQSAVAAVKLNVVRVGLDGWVPQAQKLNPGGFVRVNANNNNGSAVTNEVPAVRDFNAARLGAADPDLQQVNLTVPAGARLPGLFGLTISNDRTGRIRVWDSATKTREIPSGTRWNRATLPASIWVEGTEPAAALRDNSISLVYFNFQPGAPGLVEIGLDQVNATVTPVITRFNLAPGQVRFANGLDGANGIVSQGPGATYDAIVTRTGLPGDLVFVHNVTAYANGPGGAAAGFVRHVGLGANLNVRLTIPPATFPVLDRLAAPPPPDYDAGFRILTNTADAYRVTALDSPGVRLAPALGTTIDAVDLSTSFRLYLIWRFPGGIIYTLGTLDWSVVYRADTWAMNEGPTRLDRASGVAANPFARGHADPVRVAPVANGNFRVM